MKRRCAKCGKKKDIEEFHFTNRKKGTRNYWCKLCSNAARTESYRKNPQQFRDYAKARVLGLRRKLFEYLKEMRCEDCREDDPVVLDFDHVRGKKVSEVTKLALEGSSWKKIEREIKKCDVVCANCHRRRTAKKNGSWRHKWAKEIMGL